MIALLVGALALSAGAPMETPKLLWCTEQEQDNKLTLACTLPIKTTVTTWGFSVTAYGRAQRVTGFESLELCQNIRAIFTREHPNWILGDCEEDR